jgi:hypothetical protein
MLGKVLAETPLEMLPEMLGKILAKIEIRPEMLGKILAKKPLEILLGKILTKILSETLDRIVRVNYAVVAKMLYP